MSAVFCLLRITRSFTVIRIIPLKFFVCLICERILRKDLIDIYAVVGACLPVGRLSMALCVGPTNGRSYDFLYSFVMPSADKLVIACSLDLTQHQQRSFPLSKINKSKNSRLIFLWSQIGTLSFYIAVGVVHSFVCWPHQRPELRFPLFVCHAFGR